MKYQRLTKETKEAILEQTMTQIENEHYANTLALKRAEASGNTVNAEAIQKIITDLEKQHKALTTEK